MKPGVLFMPHGNLQYSQLPPEKRGWVARESYAKIFEISKRLGVKIAFEASGETLEILEKDAPEVLRELSAGVKAGRIEPVASPHTHLMVPNVGRRLALNTLIDGLDTWERLTGKRPVAGWNPECGWASYVPDIYREAGFEILVADADSYLLSAVPGIREATGLKFDVRGHSNKNALFKIEPQIENRPDVLLKLFRPNLLENGLNVLFRSDMMCNILLWFLMGATEGNRETPISAEEVKEMLSRWSARIPGGDGFIFPYAEDAEYVGTTAYFYVKQFGLARFFEPAPESVTRFEQALKTAVELGLDLITPSDAVARYQPVKAEGFERIENGCAWHGGTAKAWANTSYSRALDPVCASILDGLDAIGKKLGIGDQRSDEEFKKILRLVGTGYVSDSRWPPPPTSPGRFNVQEALDALDKANEAMGELMRSRGLGDQRALYSAPLMATQIAAVRAELMALDYFGEKK